MAIFYVVVAVLSLTGVLMWLWSARINPQLAAQELQALAQEQVNTYRLRLKELAHEHQLQALDEQEYQAAVNDLKRQVLHDLQLTTVTDNTHHTKSKLLVAGVGFLLLFVAAFYYSNGESAKLVAWHEAKMALPHLGERALQGKGEPLSEQELQQFALALRSKLHDSGDDVNAWVVFARVAMAIKDPDSAMLAFERAFRVNPNKPAVLLGYAQMLLMRNDDSGMRKAALLLSELLQQQPENVDALMMVGYIAEQRGDMDKARLSWQMLQQRLPANDSRLSYVEGKLAGLAKANNQAQASGKRITVQIQLAEQLTQKLPMNGTLFVYAKSVGGRPMPAAVVKLAQFNFPMTVELSDANAMLASYQLSSLEHAVIWARVSKDGDIAVSAGELQGQSSEFVVKDTESVMVVIDQLL